MRILLSFGFLLILYIFSILLHVLLGNSFEVAFYIVLKNLPWLLIASIMILGIALTYRAPSKHNFRLNIIHFSIVFVCILVWIVVFSQPQTYNNFEFSINNQTKYSNNNLPLEAINNSDSKSQMYVYSYFFNRQDVINILIDQEADPTISIINTIPKNTPRTITKFQDITLFDGKQLVFNKIVTFIQGANFKQNSTIIKLLFYICISLIYSAFVFFIGIFSHGIVLSMVIIFYYSINYIIISLAQYNLFFLYGGAVIIVVAIISYAIKNINIASPKNNSQQVNNNTTINNEI